MNTENDLRNKLRAIDHRGYPAYKSLQGSYTFSDYILHIDHVQGDPFASPSSLHVEVKAKYAGFPKELLSDRNNPLTYRNSIALADDLLRRFQRALQEYSHRAKGSGKSGTLSCSCPGQEVLARSACVFDNEGNLTVRFLVGFPAAGRTILAGELEKILFDFLPACVHKNLYYRSLSTSELMTVKNLAEDQVSLRMQVKEKGLIGFIADGSVLARESGISQRPMRNAIPFISPEQDKVSFTLPHKGTVTGMAVKPGITLIIGGGYHGKSTLLEALQRGVYDHIAGDGREFVVLDETAVKVKAEEGRSVHRVDISPFIINLPDKRDTADFTSENASGSTSQAAFVVESIEAGSKVLLMDEDTCATNFMVRDELMGRIVIAEQEPIQPYCQKMRGLYEKYGISTILAAGSSSAFFEEADTIIQMNEYRPVDVTGKVRKLVPVQHNKTEFPGIDFTQRKLQADIDLDGNRIKHKNLGRDGFSINHDSVDLRSLEQIVDPEQTELLILITVEVCRELRGRKSLQGAVSEVMKKISQAGFSAVCGNRIPGNLAMVREQDVFAVLNRCRFVR